MKNETVYMAVTCDKYELPIAVESNIATLSRKLNIRQDCIFRSLHRNKPMIRKGYKFIQVELNELVE